MFSIEFGAQGLERMQTVLKTLDKLAKQRLRADLNAKDREPISLPHRTMRTDGTNADVMQWLADKGRDFRTQDSSELDRMARAYVDKTEPQLNKVKEHDNPEKAARNVAAQGLRDMMRRYMLQVSRHIDEGKWTGGGNRELSPQYAIFKETFAKFKKPIGKFSGQLFDNLNQKGPNARNIRIKKDK